MASHGLNRLLVSEILALFSILAVCGDWMLFLVDSTHPAPFGPDDANNRTSRAKDETKFKYAGNVRTSLHFILVPS